MHLWPLSSFQRMALCRWLALLLIAGNAVQPHPSSQRPEKTAQLTCYLNVTFAESNGTTHEVVHQSCISWSLAATDSAIVTVALDISTPPKLGPAPTLSSQRLLETTSVTSPLAQALQEVKSFTTTTTSTVYISRSALLENQTGSPSPSSAATSSSQHDSTSAKPWKPSPMLITAIVVIVVGSVGVLCLAGYWFCTRRSKASGPAGKTQDVRDFQQPENNKRSTTFYPERPPIIPQPSPAGSLSPRFNSAHSMKTGRIPRFREELSENFSIGQSGFTNRGNESNYGDAGSRANYLDPGDHSFENSNPFVQSPGSTYSSRPESFKNVSMNSPGIQSPGADDTQHSGRDSISDLGNEGRYMRGNDGYQNYRDPP